METETPVEATINTEEVQQQSTDASTITPASFPIHIKYINSDGTLVKFKCDKIDCWETINLPDIGLKIKDLEIDYKPKDDIDGCYFLRMVA